MHCVCIGKTYTFIQLYNIQRSNKIPNAEKENTTLQIEQNSIAVHSCDHITHIILPRSVRT